MPWRLKLSMTLAIIAIICSVAVLLSGCGDGGIAGDMPGALFIQCVENAAAHGLTASEARQACEGWR